MSDNDLIRRGDAQELVHDYCHARTVEGRILKSPAVFTTHTGQDISDAIAALPADPRVEKLVEALRVIAQFNASTSDGQNIHSIWKMTERARAALAAWGAGK